MEVRAELHSKPALTMGLCVALALGAFFFLFYRVKGSGPSVHYTVLGDYYTADEGQTYVPDVWALIPPFDRDGKTWVRLYLFTTDGKTPIMGYLEKYDPAVQAELLKMDEPRFQWARMNELGDRALLVKRPGDANWVAKESPEGAAIIAVSGPDGQPAKPLLPELHVPR